MPGQGSGKTPQYQVQNCCVFVVVQFFAADALLRPEPEGDQGTLFARNVVQGYVRACVPSYIIFCVLYLFYFVLSAKLLPTLVGLLVRPPSIPGICRLFV